jgi:integrase/recombinase XerD
VAYKGLSVMATCLFRSPLAPRLQSFWEARYSRSRGGINNQKILLYLDRFLMSELKSGQTITREVVERWNESMAHLSPNTRINRLSVLRQFCRYLSYFEPRTCLIHRSFSPRRTRPVPHVYSRQDVSRIMTAALQLGPPGSLRPVVAASLIGLLYSTGIRIGEALNLTLKDLDLKRRVIEIREGKFRKSRYVPVSPSAARHLTKYLRQRRDAGFSTDSTAPVFLNIIGNRHGHPGFVTLFLEVLRSIGLRSPKGQPGPRIHDLRHTFAVHRLLAWYRQGANLGAKLPLLSTYLGHSTITGTEIYLQATAQLLEKAGQRFHAHFTIPPATRDKRHENP